MFALLMIALASPVLAAALQDEYFVQGDGSTVTVLTADGSTPAFTPVPVPASGGSYTFRVKILAAADGSRQVDVSPADAPAGATPAATFKITVLAAGVRLEGDRAPEGSTVLTLSALGDRVTFRGQGANLVFAFVVPGPANATLRISALNGVVETTVIPAAPAAIQEDPPPTFDPPPTTAPLLPFDLVVVSSIASFDHIDEDAWGYGLGLSIPLDPYAAVRAHAVIRWRCYTASIEEFASVEPGATPVGGGGVGDDSIPAGGGGEPGAPIGFSTRTEIDFCIADVGFSFDVQAAPGLFVGVHLAAGYFAGDVDGPRLAPVASVQLVAPVGGGSVITIGYSAVFADPDLSLAGGGDIGTLRELLAGVEFRF